MRLDMAVDDAAGGQGLVVSEVRRSVLSAGLRVEPVEPQNTSHDGVHTARAEPLATCIIAMENCLLLRPCGLQFLSTPHKTTG